MTLEEIAKSRLYSQHIAQNDFDSAKEVVKHMVAMQAQDYPGALWSIALRTKHLDQSDIEKAIVDREIVRTWPMRGTLHFMAAEDVRWMVKLLAPRATAAAASRRKALELDDNTVEKARSVIIAALKGGNCLTRNRICGILDEHGISTEGQRGIHLLRLFSEMGLLCFGPHEGKQPTFVLLDEWVPETPEKTLEEALQELAYRYFVGHGPASLKDFAGWAHLTIGNAKKGIELADKKLESATVDGVQYWFSQEIGQQDNIVRLLPGFDEFVLGYKDRSASMTPEVFQTIVPGGNGMFLPTLVINGKVVATWKKIERVRGIVIIVTPLAVIPDQFHAAIDEQVERYGVYRDIAASWQFADSPL